jgi:SRSO17 transposase
VPREIKFRTKHAIGLAQIDAALSAALPRGIINADALLASTQTSRALTARRLRYTVGIQSTTNVWPPGKGPHVPKATSKRGTQPTLLRRDAAHQLVTVQPLAVQVGRAYFRPVT